MERQFPGVWCSQSMAAVVARRYCVASLYDRTVDEEAWNTRCPTRQKCWTTISDDLLDRPTDKVNRQL
ncbi:MAG: hypothetical protein IPI17_16090 [Nitrosomonas sp.]|nr:hypothetical protein [Nitrosomonas sp.]